MPSQNNESQVRRSLAALFIVGFVVLAAVALQPLFVALAAPPGAQPETHRTPTRTPTPTPTGEIETQSTEEDEAGIDPFLGFESGTLYSTYIPNFCGGSIVTEGGEAWVVPKTTISIGDPNVLDPTAGVLYVQRCVGDFQEWTGLTGVLVLPTLVPAPTPAPATGFAFAQPVLPVAEARLDTRAVLESLEAARLATPAPYVPPILQPVFPTQPALRILPTIEAPGRFELLPQTKVSLRTPDGQIIVLDKAASFRPDLWSYQFPITSESGDYTLIIEAGGERQLRTIQVRGAARIYATNRRTNQVEVSFKSAADPIIHYADFEAGREVSVNLYRVVQVPEVGRFKPGALALVDRWTLQPAGTTMRERLSQRLHPEMGPPFGDFIFLACYVDECDQLPRIDVASKRVIWPEVVLGNIHVDPDVGVLDLPSFYETIRFAPGATQEVIGLTVSHTGVAGYLLGILGGQQLIVTFDNPNVQVYVLDPGGELLLPAAQTVGLWQFDIPQNGQYALLVYGREDAHMTVSIPAPGSGGPPLEPSADLFDRLIEELYAAEVQPVFPSESERFVDGLLGRLPEFESGTVRPDQMLAALRGEDVGSRINGIVAGVWGDWLGLAERENVNIWATDPGSLGLSPFRLLVIRLIQGTQGQLSNREKAALHNFLTRREEISTWRDNPNGIIGAINREIFR